MCNWDKQFSNWGGEWCTIDLRSTCRCPALLVQPEAHLMRLQMLSLCVHASICFAVSTAVTGLPHTPSMELSDNY